MDQLTVWLANASCKLQFILVLLTHQAEAGHCVVLFSKGRAILDKVGAGLNRIGVKFIRLDGNTAAHERKARAVFAVLSPLVVHDVVLLQMTMSSKGLPVTQCLALL